MKAKTLFVICVLGLFLVGCSSNTPLKQTDKKNGIESLKPSKKTDKKVVLYMLPTCEHCKKSWQDTKTILLTQTDVQDLKFIGKVGSSDRKVSIVFEWAKSQGKQKAFVDAWFATNSLSQTVQQIGLDPKLVDSVLNNQKWQKLAEASYQSAKNRKIKQTPTLFITGSVPAVIVGEFKEKDLIEALKPVK